MPVATWSDGRGRRYNLASVSDFIYGHKLSFLTSAVVISLLTSLRLVVPLHLGDNDNNIVMRWSSSAPIFAAVASGLGLAEGGDEGRRRVDLRWHPPANTSVNDLDAALHGTGVYGFIFNSSHTPDDEYGTYNWCNMPHVRRREYVRAPADYKLRYVEVIQRHHKRTPYASNAFPVEQYHWDCDDQGLYYYGSPFEGDKRPANGYWKGFTSSVNPFVPSGWIGSCSFPQLTADGLDDAYVHGQDIYDVYHSLLGFLPSRSRQDWRDRVVYRVTQNVITSQVAGMLIAGTWDTTDSVPLLIEAAGVDSLEPQYSCPASSRLFDGIKSDADPAWRAHLQGAEQLFATLDDISGVPPDDEGFHVSFDHYFDNLSARQCHDKPLPCKLASENDHTKATAEAGPCVDQDLADAVYRLGQWEYSHIYRDAPDSLAASASSYGVWVAELAAHLRAVVAGNNKESPLYFHNVAHDGSVSRLLAILQVDVMFWPGMGSEVIFELYEKTNKKPRAGTRIEPLPLEPHPGHDSQGAFYVRVLFGGQVLRSSNPSLGVMDMLPVETLLAYFDGLVGKDASLVIGKCNETIRS